MQLSKHLFASAFSSHVHSVNKHLSLCALRMLLLMMVVVCLNGTFMLEQPFSSFFEFYPRFREFILRLQEHGGPLAVPLLYTLGHCDNHGTIIMDTLWDLQCVMTKKNQSAGQGDRFGVLKDQGLYGFWFELMVFDLIPFVITVCRVKISKDRIMFIAIYGSKNHIVDV